MCPLVESIALKDGVLLNTTFHNERFERSYYKLYQHSPNYKLFDNLGVVLPTQGYYKLRIVYNEHEKEVSIAAYKIARIESLKCIEDNTIDYHLKFTNRNALNQLYAQRGTCDDIIIIKNNLLTDTFAGNILLCDGHDWFTPAKPLLEGTQRSFLLKQGIIKTRQISKEDIALFKEFMIINAMRPFNPLTTSSVMGIEL